MAAEIATAQHESTTVKLELIGAPDCERRDGRRFIAERVRVETWQGRTYASVTGRGILANGDLGKLPRFAGFNLRGCAWFPTAPTWLVEALKAAGVTW